MNIGNFYQKPEILTSAIRKAKLHPKSVLINPITMADFTNSDAIKISKLEQEKMSKTAFIFEVLHVGSEVTQCSTGDYIIPSSAAVDVLSPDAKHLIIQEDDIRVTMSADLLQDRSPTQSPPPPAPRIAPRIASRTTTHKE